LKPLKTIFPIDTAFEFAARQLRSPVGPDGDISASLVSARLLQASLTLALVGLTTVVLFMLRGVLPTVNLVSVTYLIPVLLAAVWWGITPAIVAAVAGAIAADYFFYPPIYSFWISDSQNIADLIVFLIVAFVCGSLAGSLRQREREQQYLYEYSKQLAASLTTADLIRAAQDYLSKCLDRPTFILKSTRLESGPGLGVPETVRHAALSLPPQDTAVTHRFIDASSHHVWLVRRISFSDAEYFIFADVPPGAVRIARMLDRRIAGALTEAAENLVRLDLAKAIEKAMMQAQADQLKNALVATMSHELRTPLVSILGAASVLSEMASVRNDARAQPLVGAIHDEAARLDSNLQNLVDAARITVGLEQPNRQWTDPVDLIHAAIAQRSTQLTSHHLEVSLAPDLPLVSVQSALVENALAQLLDNAAKYSPPGSTIKIDGRLDQDWVALSVSDQGIGLTAEEQPRIGQWSFRGRHTAEIPGSGLGLWIANTLVTANGGRLDAESAGPGLGTTVRVRLPTSRNAGRVRSK